MFLFVFWIPAWVKKRRKQPDNRFKKTLKITLKCMPFGTKFQSFWGSVFECEILTSWGRSWPRFRPPFWGILAAQTLVKRSYKGYARDRRNNPRKKQKIGPTWRRQPPVNLCSKGPESTSIRMHAICKHKKASQPASKQASKQANKQSCKQATKIQKQASKQANMYVRK